MRTRIVSASWALLAVLMGGASGVAGESRAQPALPVKVAYVTASGSDVWVETRDLQTGRRWIITPRLRPTSDAALNPSLAWSSDGRRLALSISEVREQAWRGLLVTTGSSRARRIASLPRGVLAGRDSLSWAPDGRAIAYRWANDSTCSDRPVQLKIGVTRVGRPTRILNAVPGPRRRVAILDIEWSPAGNELLVLVTHKEAGHFDESEGGNVCDYTTQELWLVDVENGSSNEIGEGEIAEAHWSPDGKSIARVDWSGKISVAQKDGSGERLLGAASVYRLVDVEWTKDSRALLVLDSLGGALFRRDVSAGGFRRIARWQPADYPAHGIVSVTPNAALVNLEILDGNQLAVVGLKMMIVPLDGSKTTPLTILKPPDARGLGSMAVLLKP